MKGSRTFPEGGIYPPTHKDLTRHLAIRNAPLPAEAIFPLQQHRGSPAEASVRPGDRVGEGMVIGRAAEAFSAHVHSSIPGVVRELRDMVPPAGGRCKAVVVDLEGAFDRSWKVREPRPWRDVPPRDLLACIRDCGIVGLGGAAFPTAFKWDLRRGTALELFVVNGMESEPYVTADHRLMLEKTSELLTGIGIACRILSPREVLIAVDEQDTEAIAALEAAIQARGLGHRVTPLEGKYPQGEEKQLLKALTGREVPSGGQSLEVGALVSNVGTLFAVCEAVVLDKPLIERVVTVSGSPFRYPGNLKVRLGTRVGDLVEECGGFSTAPARLIAGGPMTGFALAQLDTPVTKGMSGLVALSSREMGMKAWETPCISCARCLEACPWGLRPNLLYKWIRQRCYREALEEGLMDCEECGCCSYVCPARIPLTQGLSQGKLMNAGKGRR